MKQLSLLLFITAIVTSTAQAQFAGGEGTENDPYQIENVEQLQEIRNYTDKHFIQIADIDASESKNWHDGKGFEPIGDDVVKFDGSYEGTDYEIIGLYINRPDEDYIGLFGFTDGSAKIHNVGLVGNDVTGNQYVGGLIGYNRGISVTGSYTTGDVSGSFFVGGLIGRNITASNHSVTGSYATGDVSGGNNTGGLIGKNSMGNVIGSYATGAVSGKTAVGGLTGENRGVITSSYATGDVSGDNRIGGLIGDNSTDVSDSYSRSSVSGSNEVGGLVGVNRNSGYINNSYSTGKPTGDTDVGGFAGLNGETISSSYWDTESSENEQGVGRGPTDDLTGLTTAQMTGVDAFEHMNALDFDDTWHLTANYPALQWQDEIEALTLPPKKVTLLLPENEADNVSTSPVFEWAEDDRADQYIIRVAINEALENVIIDHVVTDTSFTPQAPLAFETTYFWKITAENQSGSSESETWSFTTRPELPSSITLVQPKNDTTDVSLQPEFVWEEDDIAETYEFELAADSDFNELVIDLTGIEKISLALEDSLDFLNTYYWRVRGMGDNGQGEWSDVWSFTTIIKAPEIVELVSPDSGSVDISIQPELSWSGSERAEYYQIKIAKDSEFEDIVHDSTGIEGLSLTPVTLSYNTTYYWKIKAINLAGEGEWSETWSFFTEYALEQPVLVSPEDGLEDTPIPTTFYWQPVEDAKNYVLEVAIDEEFENILDFGSSGSLAKQANTNQEIQTQDWNISQQVEELDYSTTYYWRVKAIGEQGSSDWSGTRSLITEDAPITDPVVLSSPADESTDVTFPVTLEWIAFDGADHYDLQLSKTALFNDRRSIDKIDGTSTALTELSDKTPYYWRVRATVDEQKSAWSEVWTFTTELRVPEVPVWEPAHEQQDVETTPLLVWEASERAEMYDLQLSDDPEFSDLVIDESEIQDTEYQVSEELERGAIYFWKVRAGNQSGYSEWSDALSFTTVMPTDALAEEIPNQFTLHQNYPNPFNPFTQIRFALPEPAHVTLTVYNLLGWEIATLVNENRSPGWHDVTFDASGLSSGLFIYRIEAGDFVETRSMLFLK